MSTCSKNGMHTPDHSAANRNCTQLSFTPSHVALKRSMTRMCTAKHTAHTSTSRSPAASRKLPLMHSRYSDTTDSATATQTGRLTLRLKNRPNTGTSTTYSAVRKPAFPASVPATMLEVRGDGQRRAAAKAAEPELPARGAFFRFGGLRAVLARGIQHCNEHQQREHGDGIARGVEGERADRVGADVLRDEGSAPDERGENGENNLTNRILFHMRDLL